MSTNSVPRPDGPHCTELRKAHYACDMIRGCMHRAGGCYLYSNLRADLTNVWVTSATGWGGRLSKRNCNMFSGSSPCLLGQHGSCSSAQLPVELSENMLQKPLPQLKNNLKMARLEDFVSPWSLWAGSSTFQKTLPFLG